MLFRARGGQGDTEVTTSFQRKEAKRKKPRRKMEEIGIY